MDKIFVILVFLTIAVLTSYSYQHEEEYDSYRDALASEAIKDDLVPDIHLSSSAIKLSYRKSLMFTDPRVVLTYKGQPPGSDVLGRRFREVPRGQVQMPSSPPSFWNGNFDDAYKFYYSAANNAYFAINPKSQNVWYWANKK